MMPYDNDPPDALSAGPDCPTGSGEPAAELMSFLAGFPRVCVLSGAGCSTASGIPDYRDDVGNWKHRRPVQYADFIGSDAVRRRYWAGSFAGWQRFSAARPNRAHRALARLERAGRISCLVTQNVDNLHRAAGSGNVIDLHGVLHRVRCLGCGWIISREALQQRLRSLIPDGAGATRALAPDGDVRLAAPDIGDFAVPDCERCGGILKPDVVFFGEAVPAGRVSRASEALRRSDALLIVGSSLMVFSGFRFARLAEALGKPVAIVNRGKTRADATAVCRLRGDCGDILTRAADTLT